MTGASALSLAAALLQVGILACLVIGITRGVTAASINASVAFAATLAPAAADLLGRTALDADVVVGTELTVWIAVAGLLHSVGMLGPYETSTWWDHLTHTVSAALVAALVYASLLVTLGSATGRGAGVALGTLAITFGLGLFWELAELVAREVGERYDIEPVLVVYGRRDTVLDLVFDLVGALIVVAIDLRVFVPLTAADPEITWTGILVVCLTVVSTSAVAIALLVIANRRPVATRRE